MKIFDLYETKDVKIEDPSLKKAINLDERLMIKTHGRNIEKFGKTNVNVIERMIGLLGVPGHRGKKQKIQTCNASGKYTKNAKIVITAFNAIQAKTGQNPVQVLVKAIENSAPKDEVTVIEYGGARYPQAVDVSPLRRLALSLRNIIHGAYDRAFNKKAGIAEALAEEIILTFENKPESLACQKRNESEKQADAAR